MKMRRGQKRIKILNKILENFLEFYFIEIKGCRVLNKLV